MSYNNISNNDINYSRVGIELFGANYNLFDNTIKNCSEYGINLDNREHFYDFKNNRIFNNRLENNSVGINLKMTIDDVVENNIIVHSEDGIYSDNSKILKIENNTILKTNKSIRLLNGERITITENNMQGTEKGISMSSCDTVNISSNRIIGHHTGIEMDECNQIDVDGNYISEHVFGLVSDSRTRNFIVSKNSFISNDIHAEDDGGHQWDDGKWGNYWSGLDDYNDWNGDGIVDHPVYIDDNSIDRYPLIVPWGQPWNRKIELGFMIQERTVEATKWCNFSLTAEDPDDDDPFYELRWDRDDINFDFDNLTGSFSYRPEESHVGSMEFNVTVYDQNGTRDNGTFLINVIPKNYPPVVEPIDTITTYPGELTRRTFNISDANGDTVLIWVNYTNTPFSINTYPNGMISFKANEDQVGIFYAIVEFSDNNGSRILMRINIEIIPFNIPPEIESIPDGIAYIDEEYLYEVKVNDPNPDIITFSINYSGTGQHSIDENGWISIQPTVSDLGDQTITVTVSDNNGSTVSTDLSIRVIYRNDPPSGPDDIDLRIYAGDIYQYKLPVTDPDGDVLSLSINKDLPNWLNIDDKKLLRASPVLDDVGTYSFDMNLSDGKQGYLEVDLGIEVLRGQGPEILIDDTIKIVERETKTVDLATDYSRNGTIQFNIETDEDWISLNDDKLVLSPVDGDHGSYTVEIISGIEGGPTNSISLSIEVSMNLSTLDISILLEPPSKQYEKDTILSYDLVQSGYATEIQFDLVILKDGIEIDRVKEKQGEISLDSRGSWELRISLAGNESVIESTSFLVIEDDTNDENGSSVIVMILITLVIVSVLVMFVFLYFKVSKDKKENDDQQGSESVTGSGNIEEISMEQEKKPKDQTSFDPEQL